MAPGSDSFLGGDLGGIDANGALVFCPQEGLACVEFRSGKFLMPRIWHHLPINVVYRIASKLSNFKNLIEKGQASYKEKYRDLRRDRKN